MNAQLNDFLSPDQVSVKICGIRDLETAKLLVSNGVQALGVNFWEGSKRYVDVDTAHLWLPSVKGEIVRVGLFVNHSMDFVKAVYDRGELDVVQLHGDETLADLDELRDAGIPVWRAAGVKNAQSLAELSPQLNRADAWLLDAHAPGVYGGTGDCIDWLSAGAFVSNHRETPLILAGGLRPENVAKAIQQVKPCAIDLASGVESSAAVKDPALVAELMARVSAFNS